MAGILVDTGSSWILTKAMANGLSLKLYTNNYDPVVGSTNANFTEATGGGYAAITLTGGSWTIGTDGSGNPQASYAQQTFTFTGALTTNPNIYGYYITDGTTVVAAEKFGTARTPANNGDAEKITPIIKLRNNGSLA